MSTFSRFQVTQRRQADTAHRFDWAASIGSPPWCAEGNQVGGVRSGARRRPLPADRRLDEVGFEPAYGVANPAKWMATANDTLHLVNFFESINTSYEVDAPRALGPTAGSSDALSCGHRAPITDQDHGARQSADRGTASCGSSPTGVALVQVEFKVVQYLDQREPLRSDLGRCQ